MGKTFKILGILGLVVACGACLLAGAMARELPEAKPGLYVHKDLRFTFSSPAQWEEQAPRGVEVLRVAKPNQFHLPVLTVAINDLTKGALLNDASKRYIQSVKKSVPGSSQFKILTDKPITLKDGIPARGVTFKWNYNPMVQLQSAGLIVYRGKKVVSLTGTTLLEGQTTPEKLLEMLQTLGFYE